MEFKLRSDAFDDGGPIPRHHARDLGNVSPPLAWSGAPEGTRSFALIMEGPDAPTGIFRHWGLYHIAGGRTMLPEGVEAGAKTEDLGYCINDFGELKYAGPMPAAGDPPHRYAFRLAALDTDRITQAPTMQVEEMWKAAEPHVLDVAELTGTYGR